MSLTPDEQDVLGRLEAWAERLDECMSLFGDVSRIARAEEDAIRAHYRELKEALRAEYRSTSGVRREPSPAEKQWYSHTIHEADVHLDVPVNAKPGQRMFDALYAAKDDFTHVIAGLKRVDKERP